MKVYEFGDSKKPAIMLLPGTCCSWKSFDGVRDRLSQNMHVLCVSYDGFDESENTTFISMEDEVKKIEDYIKEKCHGEICAVYGCSLGGTFVAMLASRQNIKMHYGIVGSSDFDTTGKLLGKLEGKLVVKTMYPLIHTGTMQGFMKKRFDKRMQNSDAYMQKMMEMFGVNNMRPFISKESIYNQFYTDLITVLPYQIDNPNTEIHVFYAKKMGEKYLERYYKHFKKLVIHEDDLRHEELLVRFPYQWVKRIESICHVEK